MNLINYTRTGTGMNQHTKLHYIQLEKDYKEETILRKTLEDIIADKVQVIPTRNKDQC